MRKDYEKLFSFIDAPEPAPGLFGRVMGAIETEQRRLFLRRRLTLFSGGLLVSLIILLPSWQVVQTGLVESGFAEFISLLFSDSSLVFAYWQTFVFTLAESLPVMALAMLFGALFVFLGSLTLLIKNINTMYEA